MNFIHKSLWASSYQAGDQFKKYYHYDNYPKIQSETLLKEKDNEIIIRLRYDDEEGLWVSEEPYVEFLPVESYFEDNCLLEQLLKKLDLWKRDNGYSKLTSNSWTNDILSETDMIRSHVSPVVAMNCCRILEQCKEEVFVHGDLMLSNVKLKPNRQIFVCDFENSGIGPVGWDSSTFVYSLLENELYTQAIWFSTHSDYSQEFLFVIAAVRLARSIKKDKNIDKRAFIFEKIKKEFM